ncbi:hypothetical protein QYE76_026153 [Lolium multiflorum]|uniref:Serine aminopeptidase S33 domain-containing protein n=1 Tax=Lolium multiflorum TaxID=4521 RepID=A0AAD8RH54_LOLMU|nr:hypothetical protein QYE76_026153 [Lolium multiflorum]
MTNECSAYFSLILCTTFLCLFHSVRQTSQKKNHVPQTHVLCVRAPPSHPAMSIAPHAILRPFGVNPVGRYLGRHARFCFRASSTEAVNWEKKQGNSKRTRKMKAAAEVTGLEVLCDDGFGSVTMKDYLEAVRTMPIDDGGPPRWFCPVECGQPVVNSAPLLLFLPGTHGVGMELILHHKSLGMVFQVRCLHIPVNDRTSFGGLLQIVDECIKYEHALSPNRPIFVVGDSLGGCLAISVAAHNPEIDLVLIVVNPGTSFAQNPVQAILPLLELMPNNLSVIHPHLLRYLIGIDFSQLYNKRPSVYLDSYDRAGVSISNLVLTI